MSHTFLQKQASAKKFSVSEQWRNHPVIMRSLEKGIVGKCVSNEQFAQSVFKDVLSDCFSNPDIQVFYSVIRTAFIEGNDIQVSIVTNHLASFAGECMSEICTFPASKATEILHESRTTYRLLEYIVSLSTSEITDAHETIAEAQTTLSEIGEGAEKENASIVSALELFSEERKAFEQKRMEGKELIGHSTGFQSLDSMFDGLRKGHLILIGGYTSGGKTFFSLNITKNLLEQNIHVSFYSLEMSKVDIARRLIGLMSQKNGQYLTKALFTPDEKVAFDESYSKLSRAPLKIYTGKRTLTEILASMSVDALRKETEVCVIDYAQLISTESNSEYEAMTSVATKLQAFAQKYEITIILLSQVSNESARNPDQNIIGFKGSGALGASSDVAIELVSGEESKDARVEKFAKGFPLSVKACVKKNRHGRIGEVELQFDPKTGLFDEF